VPRQTAHRAVTSTDFSRMAHRIFRQCVFEFASLPIEETFGGFLAARYWEAVRATYVRLEDPPDARQRKLTGYSYLRCIPYAFLNRVHQDLVLRRLRALSHTEFETVKWYFFHFYTLDAAASGVLPPSTDRALLTVDFAVRDEARGARTSRPDAVEKEPHHG
jgi:hypothetical protein